MPAVPTPAPASGASHPDLGVQHVWAPHTESDSEFLFARSQSRMSRAFGASLMTHVAVAVLLVVIARNLPEKTEAPLLADLNNYSIVWIPEVGPGGGGVRDSSHRGALDGVARRRRTACRPIGRVTVVVPGRATVTMEPDSRSRNNTRPNICLIPEFRIRNPPLAPAPPHVSAEPRGLQRPPHGSHISPAD